MLTTRTHLCSLQLAPDASVDDAISQATRQVLRNVVESKGALGSIGENITVDVLPHANGATTVHEWANQVAGKAPVVLIKSDESEECEPQHLPSADAGNDETIRKIQHEHARMMADLQKLARRQNETIQRQATYINDLQERDQQMAQLFSKSISRIKVDIASLKGDFLNLDEHVAAQENNQHN